MGSRKSIIREAIERLDRLMAIGQSRFQAKQVQRAISPEAGWTISTGKIHSHTTRKVYQQHALAFINWARTTHGITRLARRTSRLAPVLWQLEPGSRGEHPQTYPYNHHPLTRAGRP